MIMLLVCAARQKGVPKETPEPTQRGKESQKRRPKLKENELSKSRKKKIDRDKPRSNSG
jgi:hypothetical protein